MEDDLNFSSLFQNDTDVVALEAGQPLFKKGDQGDCLYIVKTGAVRLSNGNSVYETVGAGGMLGEMALIDAAPRSASAVAMEASTVIAVSQARFLRMVQQTPYFAIRLARLLTTRLRAMNERV
jgi:CRP/FNR family cyclic AMP-dependent transcriptional regulator